MKWPPALTDRCKALWGKMPSSHIAAALSVEAGRPFTRNAVICKMNRAGLSFHGLVPNRSRKHRPLRSELSPAQLDAIRTVEREYSRRKRAKARGQPLPPLPNRELLAAVERPAAKRKAAVTPAPAPLAVAPPPRVPAPPPPAADILPSKGIPLVQVGLFECRFIEGDPIADGPALCCGHPVAEGSSWCPGHRRLCTVPTRHPIRRAA